MKTGEIRQKYLDFFKARNHAEKPSDSLIPADPTLLFTSAGMVQFKPLWLTKGPIEFSRATTCQKCFRTQDIDLVGRTARHHTFFEMLGNFSFGDYFKKEAIEWAWEWVTGDLKLPKDALWVSVYLEDKESEEIWQKDIGIKSERIVHLGKSDNFWGPVNPEGGPCGPCSEIYIDHGPARGCGKKNCKPGCECDRFEEFWNLVFPSYNQDEKGNLKPLPKPGVDTGLGLERLAAILQSRKNNFEIDILMPVLLATAELAGKTYGKNPDDDVKLKVITDHIRAVVFLISDGVLPSNEGRGYVLRRILRRAARVGRLLGIENTFLYKIVDTVVEQMKDPYTELVNHREHVTRVVLKEEERFSETLDQGLVILNELIDECRKKKQKNVPGSSVFKLYDTFGFPLELTQEILAEHKLTVNEKEFQNAMEEQQKRARSAWAGTGEAGATDIHHQIRNQGATEFLGYERFESESVVRAIIVDGSLKDSAKSGEAIEVVLDRTPFYGESGGQVGDTGTIAGIETGAVIEVMDTLKPLQDLIIHKANVKKGGIKTGDRVKVSVDIKRRLSIARHHTATHLLQSALRQIIGTHIGQAGSLVEPDRLHFDFTHFSGLTAQELERVEARVNELIRENLPVKMEEMPVTEARKTDALAFFGEKYGQKVRVVTIGDISKEFCGGTHLTATGQIGFLKIVSETSTAAGVRRIEAIVGETAYQDMKKSEEILKKLSDNFKVSKDKLPERIEKLVMQLKAAEKEITELRSRLATGGENTVQPREIAGVKVIISSSEGLDLNALRRSGDILKSRINSGIIVLSSSFEGKGILICMITKDLCARVNAGVLVKEIISLAGGSGGGNPELGQAGCKDASKLRSALDAIPDILAKKLSAG